MEKRTLNFMQNNNLITDNPIVCAVSGGVDSVCLLHILHNLGFKVILAHVNHNKRIESNNEAIAMKELAFKMNIDYEYYSYHYDNNDNFHNDAHIARYNFFKDVCLKYNTNVIATAHHLDDQIETILMKLINGSNLYGYGGISSRYQEDGITIIRPLLHTNKAELYDYAIKNNIIYYEDNSNAEDEFLRNKIRHHIVPNLKEYSNDFYNKIQLYSSQIKEAFSFIRSISIKYLEDNNKTIDVNSFNKLDVAVKKDIISLLLEINNINKNNRIINQILEILEKPIGNKEITLDNNFRFVRNYNFASIKKKTTNIILYCCYFKHNALLVFCPVVSDNFSRTIPDVPNLPVFNTSDMLCTNICYGSSLKELYKFICSISLIIFLSRLLILVPAHFFKIFSVQFWTMDHMFMFQCTFCKTH